MGVTLGVLQNTERWMGEGDDMIFVDDESKPAIIGTGSEDYFCGAWDFGGRDGAVPFAHLYNGAQLISVAGAQRRPLLSIPLARATIPVTFRKYLKHTMEHGHANDRADNFFSVAYWYQSEPYTDFPALPGGCRTHTNHQTVMKRRGFIGSIAGAAAVSTAGFPNQPSASVSVIRAPIPAGNSR